MLDLPENQVESIKLVRSLPTGGRVLSVRGRFWGTHDAFANDFASVTVTVADDAGETRELLFDSESSARQEFDPSTIPNTGTARVRGIASSTGVDFYGTEMTKNALESQARQFAAGVAFAPTHGEREWSGVIGRTVNATVQPVDGVASAADDSEPAFLLAVESDIRLDHPRGRELVIALARGDDVGQSIGAWFTVIFVQENGDGEIERIFIDDLTLDHLAATRTPANQESDGLGLVDGIRSAVRSFSGEIMKETKIVTPSMRGAIDNAVEYAKGIRDGSINDLALTAVLQDPALAVRHVLALEQTEETVRVTLAKASTAEDLSALDADLPVDVNSDRELPETWDEEAARNILGQCDIRHVVSITDEGDAVAFVFLREGVEELAGHKPCTADSDCPGSEQCSGGQCQRSKESSTPEPQSEEGESTEAESTLSASSGVDLAGEADAEPIPRSEANAEDADTLEIDMDENALRAMLTEVVGEHLKDVKSQLTNIGERVATVEQRATPPAATEPTKTTEPAPAEKSEVASAREAKLEAQLADVLAAREADKDLMERLLSGPNRQTRAYASVAEASVLTALEEGDFSPLIERAKDQGTHPMTVRINESSSNAGKTLRRVRDAFDDNNSHVRITNSDIRVALQTAFRAFEADGGFRRPTNPWAA